MVNFCEQYGLPPIVPSRQKGKKHDKSHKNYSHKKYKNNFVKPNDFYAKKKNVSKNMINKAPIKVNVLTVVNLVILVKTVIRNLVS